MKTIELKVIDITKIKSYNGLTACIGYGDGDMHKYHVMTIGMYNDMLEQIRDGEIHVCVNSLYGFGDVSQAAKHIRDFEYLFTHTWDADACLYVQDSEKGDNSCASIFIDSEGFHLMSEYAILETSQDLRSITDKYLNLINS